MGNWIEIGPSSNRAYLALPADDEGPGVLVLHAWWGLTSVFTDICDQLAAAGFVALAPGLYPDGATTASIEEAEKLSSAQSAASDEVSAIIDAAVDQLLALPATTGAKIGVIGYSMGGYWALNISQVRPNDVSAVVTVYGTGDGDFGLARAAYLGHFAELDDFEPLEMVKAVENSIRSAGRDVTFHIYPGAGHWFVEPNRPDVYNADAANLVWERTVAFLNLHLR